MEEIKNTKQLTCFLIEQMIKLDNGKITTDIALAQAQMAKLAFELFENEKNEIDYLQDVKQLKLPSFSTRVLNVMKGNNINTIGDLLDNEENITKLNLRNLGKHSAGELLLYITHIKNTLEINNLNQ